MAADVYRPAAIDQLKVNGEKQEVPVFSMGDKKKPVDIAKASVEYAAKNHHDVILIDTAGRLQIDEAMMQELSDIKAAVDVADTVLVVDAMTGQEAVNVASTFDEKVGIDGIILTKLDGDTRGGAAPFRPGCDRQAHSLLRYGREAFGPRALLSGPDDEADTGNGRCLLPD